LEAIKGIPGRRHVCLEEGTQSAWVHGLLEPHAEEVVVAMPEKRPKGAPKDDARDAWELGEKLRVGAPMTRVYKGSQHMAALRNAVRAHCTLVGDVVRAKNRVRAVLRSRGVVANAGVYNPKTRNEYLDQLSGSYRRLAACLCREVDELEVLRDEATAWLAKEAKTHPIIRKLCTAPGMGPIRAAVVVAVTATPYRFRTVRQYWSYCGLGIVTHSSSDWRMQNGKWVRAQVPQTRGLTRRRQPLLKATFKGAAMTVITMPNHPLQAKYARMLNNRIKPYLASLTLARQIAAIVLAMWKHQEVYNPKKH
jgi:transposase